MKTLKEGFFGNVGIGKTTMIKTWLEEMDIKNYTINSDYTIDVKGSVSLSNKDITELPEYIQFGTVTDAFLCITCKNLTSLRGFPKTVTHFLCANCDKLKSLEGGPSQCSIYSIMFLPKLKSLKGAPKKVNVFTCKYCNILDLNYGPTEGYTNKNIYKYTVSFCEKLKTLIGIPNDGFIEYLNICKNTKLKDLHKLPECNHLDLHGNSSLINLDGITKVNDYINVELCGKQFSPYEILTACNITKLGKSHSLNIHN